MTQQALSLPWVSSFHRPRLRRWVSVALVALAGTVGVSTWAQAPATSARSLTEWLTRMHEASREMAYVGTLVVSAGTDMSASRIWHVCDGRQQMERVETLTGVPRTTIRRNNEVITFIPESKTAWVEKRESLGLFPELLRTPSNTIAEFYAVNERDTERVAGHLADVVDIVPKDGLRFGYRIWAEKKTGLVVKLQTLDQDKVLEQVAFSELQMDAPVRMDKLAKQMKDTRGYEVHRPVMKKTTPEAQGWRLKEPVPGFASMNCYVREGTQIAPAEASVQWVFSDGLASVSLFLEPFDSQRHTQEQVIAAGATHSLTRRMGEYWVTAIGEVPPTALRRLVLALERTR